MRRLLGMSLIAGTLLASSCASSTDSPLPSEPQTQQEFPQEFHAEGNRIVDGQGNATVLRGVNAIDPLAQATFGEPSLGTWDKAYYAAMAGWGVELVRLPIHPPLWFDNPEQSLEILDQSVKWIGELGMYAVIDSHSIGMATTGIFEAPEYEVTIQQLKDYWRAISSHFQGNDVVAFYDLFNEPVNLDRVDAEGRDNADDWHEWKLLAEELIDVIRNKDPDSIAIVGGMYWAADLSYVSDDPVNRSNVVYGVHPYPGSIDNRPWQEAFGDASDAYPVLATEIGFTDETTRANILVNFPDVSDTDDPDAFNPNYLESTYSDGVYRDDIAAFLDDRGIGWTAWSFSPVWVPILFENWDYKPTEAGEFFKSQL